MIIAFVVGTILYKQQGSGVVGADCAIVFGAAVYGYDQPGPAMLRRINTAAALYREGSVRRLILTGGQGRGLGYSLAESEVMMREAITQGVSRHHITTEDRSHSTLENLVYARPLTEGCLDIVGISDGYHLARIELLAYQLGFGDLATIPADIQPEKASKTRSVIRETAAYIYYAFFLHKFFEEDLADERQILQSSDSSVSSDSSDSSVQPLAFTLEAL